MNAEKVALVHDRIRAMAEPLGYHCLSTRGDDTVVLEVREYRITAITTPTGLLGPVSVRYRKTGTIMDGNPSGVKDRYARLEDLLKKYATSTGRW